MHHNTLEQKHFENCKPDPIAPHAQNWKRLTKDENNNRPVESIKAYRLKASKYTNNRYGTPLKTTPT